MLKLVIANKNYSSWSLRAWLMLVEANIPFEEIQLMLGTKDFAQAIASFSPAGRVPVLLDDDFAVWDSLAIAEYLSERFPTLGIWPGEPKARAQARSVCAEMHAGFASLRSSMPMNVEASLPGMGWTIAVQRDVDRLIGMWRALLTEHGGPFLFGSFGAADAFFAPVAFRLRTYDVPLPPDSAIYRDRLLACKGMQTWAAAARQEHHFLEADERYRAHL